METKEGTTELELIQLLRVLFKRLWIIILAAAAAGGIFFAYTNFFVQPVYTAQTTLYVNNKSMLAGDNNVSISQGDLTAAQSLIETYGVILKSQSTLTEVIQNAGVPYTCRDLEKMISSEAINSTEIFRVKVTCPDPQEAKLIADAVSKVLPQKISSIVDGSSVRIVDPAQLPVQPSAPNILFYTFLGILLGGFLSCAVIVIQELRDDQIRDTDYIIQHYDTPILAVIPTLKKNPTESGYGYSVYASSGHTEQANAPDDAESRTIGSDMGSNLSFAASETYKLLRTNLEFSTPADRTCQIIGVTSSTRHEGKTITAINTAYTFAQTGKNVLLLEADMRLPNIARRLGLNPTPGLSNLLSFRNESQGALQKSSLIDHMWVICAGDRPPNPAELLGSSSMKKLFETLAESFDVIIVDLPPVGIVSDALTVSKFLDGIVVVVREKMCTRRGLAEVLQKLNFVNAKIMGIAVTGSEISKKTYYRKKSRDYGGDYNNDYGSGYGHSYERAGK